MGAEICQESCVTVHQRSNPKVFFKRPEFRVLIALQSRFWTQEKTEELMISPNGLASQSTIFADYGGNA